MADRLIVRTVGLAKVFKDFWRRDKVVAVQDLNLEIRQGQVFGLLGPNGSGKSTTIKMLLGLLYPTRGRISIFGRPPTDVATKSRIGYLPEESYLYRFLNAAETLQLYAKLFQLPKDVRHARIDKLLEMVGLQHQSKRRIGEYSKGMARRIGLAQALINDPDFLILDEPTTGMDPIGTQQIKQLIRELAKRGKTILLSSHLLSDVQDVCDHVCILYGGQARAEGELDQLLREDQTTQITTPRLKEETVVEIRDLIRRREQQEVFAVDHPSERLENFFMRIVQEAQASRVATSGAQAGGVVPDFLSPEDGQGLIKSLMSAAGKPSPAERIVRGDQPVPPQERESSHVLEELLDETPAPPPDRRPAPASQLEGELPLASGHPAKPRPDVIEELLRNAEDK